MTTEQRSLTTLRDRADLEPYELRGKTPGWVRRLSTLSRSDTGTLALLGPTGLVIRTTQGSTKLRPDPGTLLLTALGDHVNRSRGRVAVACPPGGLQLPLLMASSALLANTLDVELGSEPAGKGVMVISPNLAARSRYCDLSVGHVQLDAAHRGYRIRRDGSFVPLRPNVDAEGDGGICFYSPSGQLPARLEWSPGLVIIECRFAKGLTRLKEITEWVGQVCPRAGVIALYSLGDYEAHTILGAADYTEFPFDHRAVRTALTSTLWQDRDGLADDWQIADAVRFLDRRHTVIGVAPPERLAEVAGVLSDLKATDDPDLRRARWIHSVIAQLAVSPSWYEEAARRKGRFGLRSSINRLGSKVLSPDLQTPIQTVKVLLEMAYEQLSEANPKGDELKTVLQERLSGSGQGNVLVLARDEVTALATREWLDLEVLSPSDVDRVRVGHCYNFQNLATTRFSSVVATGPVPSRHRWLLGAALGDEVVFLAYPKEVPAVEAQLGFVYGLNAQAARARARANAVAALTWQPLEGDADGEAEPYELNVTLPVAPVETTVRPVKTKTRRRPSRPVTSLQDLVGAVADAQADQTVLEETGLTSERVDDEPSDEQPDFDDAAFDSEEDSLWAVKVEVVSRQRGLGHIWLAEDVAVDRVRDNQQGKLGKVAPWELRPGDTLLRVDERGRASLFDRIVEIVEAQPGTSHLGTYRDAWRSAVGRAAVTFSQGRVLDSERLLTAVRAAGATVTSAQTVANWVHDQVIGPAEAASISAIGKVTGSRNLVDHAQAFHRAFESIRSIHRAIGHRIAAVLRRTVSDFSESNWGGGLADELALPIEELLETIDYVEVQAVDPEAQKVSPARVGQFIPSG